MDRREENPTDQEESGRYGEKDDEQDREHELSDAWPATVPKTATNRKPDIVHDLVAPPHGGLAFVIDDRQLVRAEMTVPLAKPGIDRGV